MFQVALCEDEKIFAKTQAQLCRDILCGMRVEYELSVFENAEAFLGAFVTDGRRFDLMLLDIVMDGMDGVALAGKIREADTAGEIVFITSSRAYAIDGYDVGALHYLLKPVDAALLERLIKRVYGEKTQAGYFMLKTGMRSLRIALKDIIVLETAGRKVAIKTATETFHYVGKIATLLEELPKGRFIRCHQSYAVSLRAIREVNRLEAVTVTGWRVPISQPYLKAVQTAFLMNMQEC